jgi:uncharacterized protein (DUF1778 family)
MNTKKKAPKEKFSAAVRISMRPAERELVDRAVELSGGRGELSDFGRTAILEKAKQVVLSDVANEAMRAMDRQAVALLNHGLSPFCHAGRDGDCDWPECPQIREGEPEATGRHCPLDHGSEEV